MKYIKLFEGYLDGDWEKVDSSDELPPVVSMSNNNIKRVINLFDVVKSDDVFIRKDLSNVEGRLTIEIRESHSKKWVVIYMSPKTHTIGNSQYHQINISEGEDDYFRVGAFYKNVDKAGTMGMKSNYYKCDQLEGLVKLLKDKKII